MPLVSFTPGLTSASKGNNAQAPADRCWFHDVFLPVRDSNDAPRAAFALSTGRTGQRSEPCGGRSLPGLSP